MFLNFDIDTVMSQHSGRLQMTLFDYTFSLLDWAPSLPFAVVFLALYLSLHSVVYRLLLLGTSFRSAGYHKQSSVLTDVMQSVLSAFIWYTPLQNDKDFSSHIVLSWFAVTAMYRGLINPLDPSVIPSNPQVT